MFFFHFRKLSDTFSAWWRNFFGQVVELVFYLSIGVVGGKLLFTKILIRRFGDWYTKLWPSGKGFLALLSKSNATCTKEFFDAFFGKFFQTFPEIEKRKFRPLVKKLSGGVFENPIYVSSWAFCGKPLFFKKNSFLIIIGSWAKSLHALSMFLGGASKFTFYVFIGTKNFLKYINFFQRFSLFLSSSDTGRKKVRFCCQNFVSSFV